MIIVKFASKNDFSKLRQMRKEIFHDELKVQQD